jgi:hypothetical protein
VVEATIAIITATEEDAMPLRTTVVALISAAALVTGVGAATSANASTSHTGTPYICAYMSEGVSGLTAVQVIKAVDSEMPHACGFAVSGQFDGPGFTMDGWELDGTATYGALGAVHIAWLDQGLVLDFYRAGGGEYLRIYEDGAPNAAPDINVRSMWQAFGISSALVKAAGSAKWIKLTAAQQKKITPELGVPLTAAALAGDVAQGSGKPWKLGGSKTVDGVHCTVLIAPVNNSGAGYLGESLYVDTATGLPLGIDYVSQDSQSVTASFGHWGMVAAVSPPPAAKVVVG